MNDKPLIDGQYLVEKRSSQSGFKMSDWTFVVLSDFPPVQRSAMGTVRVRGFIDSYELRQYNLLPLKGSGMFLPLKAAIRKKIGKGEGDFVHVTLYADDSPVVVPDYILVCLKDSPKAYDFFSSLSASNQKYYVDWIEEAKKMETKVERLARAIERLENGLRFYDWRGSG